MPPRRAFLCLIFWASLLCLPVPSAQSHTTHAVISLRRESFDPLQQDPTATIAQASTASSLLLVQLQHAPDADTPAQLAAAGFLPLVYVPDNTFVVRSAGRATPTHAPWLRWMGPFKPDYKFPASLDPLVHSGAAPNAADKRVIDVYMLATPDTGSSALAQAVTAAGGTVMNAAGTLIHARLPASIAPSLMARDDILWIEPVVPLRIANDKANEIIGVPAMRQQLGLDGSGQIVAVTDTGLDVQGHLSADFAGRVTRGFSRQEMNAACSISSNGATWSDANGHGTHVTGTLLGSGALSPPGASFAGVAPKASVVVQAVSSGSDDLDCLPDDASFLAQAYNAGARVQNASFGGPTGQSGDEAFGRYTTRAQAIDAFLWQHKDHLLVAAVGNSGSDTNNDGVIDNDSVEQPATAKNVLSVGASENNRPPTDATCATNTPQDVCWQNLHFTRAPLANDFVSDNPNGMAAFSGRGPADDGRIKPEIVAPGTNIISSRSHDASASYPTPYNQDYAYESGTSMATPLVSGMAALTRQWLAQHHGIDQPSAALMKALLLNGATNISPGQYGEGIQREIPAAWPNNVEGWGRANMTATIGHGDPQRVWFDDNPGGLQTGQTVSYTLQISAGQPLRVTLAWTDYPASPIALKTLVNDLDLEVQTPDGLMIGNASAALPATCRSMEGADRCNTSESIEIAAPQNGTYVIRVRAAVVAQGGAQPFALVAGAAHIARVPALPAPTLRNISVNGSPTVALAWTTSPGATLYEVNQQATSPADAAARTASFIIAATSFSVVEDVGTYTFRVRACNASGCGSYSEPVSVQVITPPQKIWLPFAPHD